MKAKYRNRKGYWWTKIRAVEKRGMFTRDNHDKAMSWDTCACGKQDRRIPRDDEGAPIDSQLRLFGIDFYTFVIMHDFEKAADTLDAIETRAAEIIAQVEASRDS